MHLSTIIKSSCALMALAVVSTIPRSASALRLTTLNDGFESSRGNWFFAGEGNSQGDFFQNNALARSGNWGAFLWAIEDSWHSVGRTVSITGWTSANRGVCRSQIWAKSSGEPFAHIVLEVIDPVTWTYVSKMSSLAISDRGWVVVATNEWVPPRGEVVVRLSAGRVLNPLRFTTEEFVFVDDMTTQCAF